MKKTKTILAGLLAATTIISACGCQSNQAGKNTDEGTNSAVKDGVVSENIFEDFKYMSEMGSLSSADVSISLAVTDTMNLDGKMNIKGDEKVVQVDIPKLTFEVKGFSDEPTIYNFSDITIVCDETTKKTYISEASVRGIVSAVGGDSIDISSFNCDSEWVEISSDDTASAGVTMPAALDDVARVEGIFKDTIFPEFKDAFKDSEDKFYTYNKHGIKLDNNNVTTFVDILLTMCEDGSIKTILEAADEAKLITHDVEHNYDEEKEEYVPVEQPYDVEEAVAEFKTNLETLKTKLADSKDTIEAKIVTSVSGKKGSMVANCTMTVNATTHTEATESAEAQDTNAKLTIDCKLVEGTPTYVIPEAAIPLNEYLNSIMNAAGEQPNDSNTDESID